MGWKMPKGIWKNNAVGDGDDHQLLEYIDIGYTENPPTGHISGRDNIILEFEELWSGSGPCRLPVKDIEGKWMDTYDLNYAFVRRTLKGGNWTKIK